MVPRGGTSLHCQKPEAHLPGVSLTKFVEGPSSCPLTPHTLSRLKFALVHLLFPIRLLLIFLFWKSVDNGAIGQKERETQM